MKTLTFNEAKALAAERARRLMQQAQAKADPAAQKKWRESLLTQARLRRMGAVSYDDKPSTAR
jgi:hypothetical protein